MSNHAFLCGDFKELAHIQKTDALNVNGAAEVVDAVVTMWVDLLDGGSLVELIGVNDGVYFLLFTPVDELCPHLLHLGKVELASPTESEQVVIVEVQLLHSQLTGCLHPFFKVDNALVHLGVSVAHETRLGHFLWL